jgi:hypothetical protein
MIALTVTTRRQVEEEARCFSVADPPLHNLLPNLAVSRCMVQVTHGRQWAGPDGYTLDD